MSPAAADSDAGDALAAAVAELTDAAARLRRGDIDPGQAAALVEACAELAARVGAELDRAARVAAAEPPGAGQETLL